MRGSDERSGSLFSYVDLEARVRPDHPLRKIREIVNAALSDLSTAFAGCTGPRLHQRGSFGPCCCKPSMASSSERQLMERLEFDLLSRWFVGLGVDDPVWDHSTFSKNRDRLLEGEIAAKFHSAVMAQPKVKRLLSSDHFSVDGTRSRRGLRSRASAGRTETTTTVRGRDATLSAASTRRSVQTRRTKARPTRRPGRRRENRHGLAVGGIVSQATGTAERETALALIDSRHPTGRRITLGADKAYDVTQFVHDLRERSVTPRIAIDGHLSKAGIPRKTAVDARTTRHAGYDISQRCRKRIEEVFGWIKSSAGLAKVKLRGRERVDAAFTLALAA